MRSAHAPGETVTGLLGTAAMSGSNDWRLYLAEQTGLKESRWLPIAYYLKGKDALSPNDTACGCPNNPIGYFAFTNSLNLGYNGRQVSGQALSSDHFLNCLNSK